jgi:hypothetical protein
MIQQIFMKSEICNDISTEIVPADCNVSQLHTYTPFPFPFVINTWTIAIHLIGVGPIQLFLPHKDIEMVDHFFHSSYSN